MSLSFSRFGSLKARFGRLPIAARMSLRHGGAQRDALLVAHGERGAGHALRRAAGNAGGGKALPGIFLRSVGVRGDPVLA